MSIQIDNGDFTRIHNDILDGLARAHFTALEFRCVVFLVRKTYGWQKKEDVISLKQWAEGLGMDDKNKGNILNALDGLVAKGVIRKRSNGNNRPVSWGINKAYFDTQTVISEDNSLGDECDETVISQHNSSKPTVISGHNRTVISGDNKLLCPDITTKEKKEILKKDTRESLPAAKVDTPQQEFFAAVCEALGWDYRTLSKADKDQVAQAMGILMKAKYTVDDIHRFMVEVWFKDWRWEKKHEYPTIRILRQEIGKIHSMIPSVAPPVKEKGVNGFRSMLAGQGIEI